MSLVNNKKARILEKLGDIDYELMYVPGAKNTVADALSRAPVELKLDIPDPWVSTTTVPPGFTKLEMSGGGDSLFQCLSLYQTSVIDNHKKLRETLVEELILNKEKYNITPSRDVTKHLQLMKHVGQLPAYIILQVYSDKEQVQVVVYYSERSFLKYGRDDLQDKCYLQCLSGVHYNLLTRLGKPVKEVEIVAQVATLEDGGQETTFQETLLVDESFEEESILEIPINLESTEEESWYNIEASAKETNVNHLFIGHNIETSAKETNVNHIFIGQVNGAESPE
jgi:hypothetical protein